MTENILKNNIIKYLNARINDCEKIIYNYKNNNFLIEIETTKYMQFKYLKHKIENGDFG